MTFKLLYFSFLLLFLVFALPALAVQDIRVVALFSNKVMAEIDGKRTLLKVGEPTADGVELISSDFEEAVIRVNDQQATFNLSDRVSSSFSVTRAPEALIKRHISGAYVTTGSINGQRVEMMVDTGATAVALSENEAKRLNIPYNKKGIETKVQTASGISVAWQLQLDSVKIGGIELRGVGAVIVKGDSPKMVLLGMTFLGQLEMNNEGSLMVIRQR